MVVKVRRTAVVEDLVKSGCSYDETPHCRGLGSAMWASITVLGPPGGRDGKPKDQGLAPITGVIISSDMVLSVQDRIANHGPRPFGTSRVRVAACLAFDDAATSSGNSRARQPLRLTAVKAKAPSVMLCGLVDLLLGFPPSFFLSSSAFAHRQIRDRHFIVRTAIAIHFLHANSILTFWDTSGKKLLLLSRTFHISDPKLHVVLAFL